MIDKDVEIIKEEVPMTATKEAEDALYGEGTLEGDELKVSTNVEVKDEVEVKEEVVEKKEEVKEGDWKLEAKEDLILDKEAIKEIELFAKENGLNKEQAEKLLDNQNENIREYKQSQEDAYWVEVEGWKSQLREDKDFGGERFNKNVELASKAFKKFMDPETQKLFDEKGYGNFPPLVKAFAKIGAEFFGDTMERGNSGDVSTKSAEELLYG